jgi:hypothetical protein
MSVKRVTINGTRVMARMSPATTSTLRAPHTAG